LPEPLTKSPAAAIRPRRWMSAPKKDLPFSIILMPLYSGGLCEPVIITAPSAPMACEA
jgi:hypothetical protein